MITLEELIVGPSGRKWHTKYYKDFVLGRGKWQEWNNMEIVEN